jgi:hypothetical protein
MGEPPELPESPVLPSGSEPEEVGFAEADAEVDGLATACEGLATAAEGLGPALVCVAAGVLEATDFGVALGAGVGVGMGCAVGFGVGVTQVAKAKARFGFPGKVPQAEPSSRAWPLG